MTLACLACGDQGPSDAPPALPEAAPEEGAEPVPTAAAGDAPGGAGPTPAPTPPRFIHSPDAEAMAATGAGMQAIAEELGYALVPSALPAGFRPTMARIIDLPSRPMATVFYESAHMRLALFYPAQFAPVTEPGTVPPRFSPPEDAVVRVVVSDELAYLMRGEWDDHTVQLLASYTAQWEYNGRMTLYFPYEAVSGQSEWAMLSANTQREPWIGVTGLIAIAESVGPAP